MVKFANHLKGAGKKNISVKLTVRYSKWKELTSKKKKNSESVTEKEKIDQSSDNLQNFKPPKKKSRRTRTTKLFKEAAEQLEVLFNSKSHINAL